MPSAAEPLTRFQPRRQRPPLAAVDTPPPAPPRINWSAAAVVLALLAQFVGIVVFATALERRVIAVEQAVGPLQDGQLARIDERTEAMQRAIERILNRLESSGR